MTGNCDESLWGIQSLFLDLVFQTGLSCSLLLSSMEASLQGISCERLINGLWMQARGLALQSLSNLPRCAPVCRSRLHALLHDRHPLLASRTGGAGRACRVECDVRESKKSKCKRQTGAAFVLWR